MRRLALICLVLGLAGGVLAAGSWAYLQAHAKASAKFKIAEAGDVKLVIAPIEGSLAPGGSLTVKFEVSNGTAWTQKVGRVVLDEPGVTNLPASCPESAFGWASKPLNVVLAPSESVKGSGELSLDKGAPAACAGTTEPVLHLTLKGGE